MALHSLWFFFVSVFISGLQIKTAYAGDIKHNSLVEALYEKRLETEEFVNGESYGYDEGDDFEDADDHDHDHDHDDNPLTDEELRELQQMMAVYRDDHNAIDAVIDGVTYVNMSHTYLLYSHDEFPTTNYENNFFRYFNFVRDPDVLALTVYCPSFHIQKSFRCKKDRFVVYLPPYTNGKRFCGRRNNHFRKYLYTDLRLVFKSNQNVRKSGFACEVTPGGCCDITPKKPRKRRVVYSCADILPGYDHCTCSNLTTGICLTCSFCETCDLEFLAVHDFRQTQLYINFNLPCNDCPMNISALHYGHANAVAGYVSCLNPNPNVTLPTYDSFALNIVTLCPVNPAFLDVCDSFQNLIDLQGGRSSLQSGLGKSCNANMNLIIPLENVDLTSINNPECYRTIKITGNPCNNFNGGGAIDLSAFTNLERLDLNHCNATLNCGSIVVNSPSIVSVHSSTNCDPSCLVTNFATPSVPPEIICA